MMKATKYYIICLMMFFLSNHQAWAEDWILYKTSPEGKMYYSKSNIIKTNKNIVQVRTKTILNEKGKINAFAILKKLGIAPCNVQSVSHEVTEEHYDCQNKKYKIFSTTIYDAGNKVLVSQKAIGNKWSDVRSKAAVGKLMNTVCNLASDPGKQ